LLWRVDLLYPAACSLKENEMNYFIKRENGSVVGPMTSREVKSFYDSHSFEILETIEPKRFQEPIATSWRLDA
jgi:hypothetical protein